MNSPLPQKNNLCAIVVTYFPDVRFAEYLLGIRAQCDSVIIVDNGSTGPALDMLRSLCDRQVSLFETGSNAGLGAALNQGVAQARARGYDWAVLFDQDSLPLGDMAGSFSGILAAHPEPNRVAIIGCGFIDRNRHPTPVQLPVIPGEPLWTEKKRVITSGMLLSLQAFEAIGSFREEFFIDTIDHEFCHRARLKGWRILKTATPLLAHSVGNYRRHRFLWFDVWRSHHSALRCYFMARNPMILARESRAYAKLVRGGFNALKNAFLILFLEEDKARKIKATLCGYLHGILRRTEMPEWIKRQASRASEGALEG